MKRIALAITLTVACCLAAAASLSAHAASTSSPPCTPKITKVAGHQAGVNCGPATAILHIAGKTYTFRNGFCEQNKAAAAALLLDLGTIVTGVKGNAGKSYFSLTIGRVHTTAAVSGADFGGKDLIGDAVPLIDVKGSVPAKGTFTQRFATGTKFTGSWNCHGVVWSAP